MLMKTDPKTLRELEVPDLSSFSIKGLSYVLRHKELWPEDFDWYFPCGCTCAIGLSHKIWKYFDSPFLVDSPFGVSSWENLGINPEYVTPEMVADKVDEKLGKNHD